MSNKSAYYHVTDGEWVQIDLRGNKEQCCDCGLVHKINYRFNKKTGKLEYQVFRDKRATSAVRKSFKFTKEEL